MSLCVKCATVAILMFTYIPVPDQTILQERNKLYDIHDCQVLVAIDTSNHEDRNGVQSRLTVQYLEYCTDRHSHRQTGTGPALQRGPHSRAFSGGPTQTTGPGEG